MTADLQRRIIRIETTHTLTVMNFSGDPQARQPTLEWVPLLDSFPFTGDGTLPLFGASILRRR